MNNNPNTTKSKYNLFAIAIIALCICLTGCATSKTIPSSYLKPKHELSVVVVKVPEKPQMQDSGQGGIIGAIITGTSRKSMMKEMMEGIQGETIKGLLLQEVNRLLQDQFDLADSANDLKLNIRIDQFGFFVPTTVAGIKTGAYQFQIVGYAEILDEKLKSKKVAYVNAFSSYPLGDKPSKESVAEALDHIVGQFASRVVHVLVVGDQK